MIDLPYRPNWAHEEVTGRTPKDDIELQLARAEKVKTLPIGEVVYYIKKNGNHNWKVEFGTIREQYRGDVVINLYEVLETRLVNGIPYNDFPARTELKKLPKGWTYNTRLYEITNASIPEEMYQAAKTISFRDRAGTKKLIDMGYLVPVSSIDYSHIETEFVKHEGYRLVKRYYQDEYHADNTTCYAWEVFTDYEEAQKYIDEHFLEMQFESNMSDLEWAVYQIDRVLDKASLYMTKTERNEIREHLLDMENIEDIEIRLYMGKVQWKYLKNNKWNNIEN